MPAIDPAPATAAQPTGGRMRPALSFVTSQAAPMKPAGIIGAAWLVTKLSAGRIRPPVGWAAVAGAGSIAGIGYTVSLLIADHAFRGQQLAEAKLGVLTAALCASIL